MTLLRKPQIMVTPEELADVAELRLDGVISSKQANEVIRVLWNNRVEKLRLAFFPDLPEREGRALAHLYPWQELLNADNNKTD